MNVKRILLLTLILFAICLFIPKTSHAISLQEMFTPENSIITKVQEGIEYFFAFKNENKVQVLEKQAEKRLTFAQGYADKGNDQKVQSLMQNYLQIKDKQNNLLEKINNGEVLGTVEDRTIEQQKTMEEIKIKIDEDGKKNVIKVQEKVVNQVAKRVVEVNGKEGQTEFLNKVVHVWAPGTGPGGEAGVVYAGGGKLMYAPGTSAGGQGGVVVVGGEMKFAPGTSGTEIKTVVDHPNTEEPVSAGGGNLAPGTTQGGTRGNTVDSGGVDPGTTSDSKTWIAP